MKLSSEEWRVYVALQMGGVKYETVIANNGYIRYKTWCINHKDIVWALVSLHDKGIIALDCTRRSQWDQFQHYGPDTKFIISPSIEIELEEGELSDGQA
jgi:hypothetical protein